MNEDHQLELAEARKQGAAAATKRALVALGMLGLLLVLGVGLGWTLVARAQEAAPSVIEEIASERQAAVEARVAIRTAEARRLAGDVFVFLQRVWDENESLERVRSKLNAATNQMRLLTNEVNAAFNSPTRNLGTLLDHGPTRASAVLDYAVEIAAELQKLVPLVMGALNNARLAVGQADSGLLALFDALDELLEPFIGTNEPLRAQWAAVKSETLAWKQRVADDIEAARAEISGDALSDEFGRRLRARLF